MSEDKNDISLQDNTVIEDAITLISKMDTADEEYKRNKNLNIHKLKELKKAINNYCDTSDSWNMFFAFDVGVIIAIIVVFICKGL